MFDAPFVRVCALLEDRSAISHRRATKEQLEAFEERIGLRLPEQFREFVSRIGDGADVKDYLQLEPLCPENRVAIDNPAGNCNGCRLIVYPLRDVRYGDGEHWYLMGWNELNGHEKMESEVALEFAEGWWDFSFALVLNGEHQGRVYCGSLYSSRSSLENEFDGLLFLDWLEKMLTDKEEFRP